MTENKLRDFWGHPGVSWLWRRHDRARTSTPHLRRRPLNDAQLPADVDDEVVTALRRKTTHPVGPCVACGRVSGRRTDFSAVRVFVFLDLLAITTTNQFSAASLSPVTAHRNLFLDLLLRFLPFPLAHKHTPSPFAMLYKIAAVFAVFAAVSVRAEDLGSALC